MWSKVVKIGYPFARKKKKKKTSFITPCVTTNTERFIDLYVRPRARSTLEANVFLWELCDLKLRG